MKHFIFLTKTSSQWSWGGCEKQLLDYFLKVDYRFNKITLISTDDIFSQRFRDRGLPVKIQIFPFGFNGSFRRTFINMFIFLKSLKPDYIVFVQGGFLNFKLPDFLAAYILTKGNIFSLEVLGAPPPPKKTKSRLHFKVIPGIGLWWWKKMVPIILRGWLCKKIITGSEGVKERMVRWYYYPRKKIFTIYHGTNVNELSPDVHIRKIMRKKLSIPESHTVINCIARLAEVKKVDRLINAFDILSNDFKNCWLILIGDGPLQGELERLAKQKSSKERIIFLGYQANIYDFLKMSDIFVLPSDNEGFSNAMLEAMATGLICVITKTPGSSEAIKDGINGFLVEPSEEGVLLGLNKALTLTKEQQEEIANNAHQSVKKNFNLENGVQRNLEILGLSRKT